MILRYLEHKGLNHLKNGVYGIRYLAIYYKLLIFNSCIGCGDPLHPGVYTRVTKLQSWIQEKTGIRPSITGSDFGLTCSSGTPEDAAVEKQPTKKPEAIPEAKPEEPTGGNDVALNDKLNNFDNTGEDAPQTIIDKDLQKVGNKF